MVGASTSRHLAPADDFNVTVIIEDTSLLPGYGDKQVKTTDEFTESNVVSTAKFVRRTKKRFKKEFNLIIKRPIIIFAN